MLSDDPSLWVIDFYRLYSYVAVASSTAVIYDWILIFGQEIDMVWRQRWSIMSVLYLSVRYTGILYSIATMLACLPSVSVTNVVSNIMVFVPVWTSFVVNTILSVIMIARLYAMYQGSRNMVIFLLVTFLALTIACGVIAAIQSNHLYGNEYVLYNTYQCIDGGNVQLLTAETWIFGTIWEVLALCLAVWATVKHIRELQQSTTIGFAVEDCFAVLIKSHVFYFASYATVSCFSLGLLSPKISSSSSVGVQIYYGIFQITMLMQMFVLGPRLILSVRQFYAKLVANADEGTGTASIYFQELVHLSTNSGYSL